MYEAMELEIKCAHEMGSTEKQVPDYHPLTKHELWALLNLASVASSRLVNTIQCRLTKAVRGMVCPIPYDTEVGRRLVAMDSLYIGTLHQDPSRLPDMVEEFYRLLEPDDSENHASA